MMDSSGRVGFRPLSDLLHGDHSKISGLPDGRELLMIGTIGKRCTCRDDNLCTTADAFIHSKLLVYCPVLRHRLPPKSRASVHSHKHVHPARTGLPLKPRRTTRPAKSSRRQSGVSSGTAL